MLTSTLGVIVIVIGGLVALAALEGIVLYAAARPTWKTGPGASREGLHDLSAAKALPTSDAPAERESPVPVGAGRP